MKDETTVGQVQPLPYEVADTSDKSPEESLFDALASDPDFTEEADTTEDTDESESDDADGADDSEPEDDDSEDDGPEDEDDEGDLEDEEDDDDGDGEEPELVEVTLPGGEKAKVTLDELTKGYSRTQDYTRKTQELATQRKSLEADLTKTAQVREQYGVLLEQLETALKPNQNVDWDKLRKENPGEFSVRWADHQRQLEDLKVIEAEKRKLQEEAAEDQQKLFRAHLAEESEKLLTAIPEWKDQKVAKSEKKKIFEFARDDLGFSEGELKNLVDHRALVAIRDAQRYRELTTKGKKVVKEKAKKAKVLKPGSRVEKSARSTKNTELKRAQKRLARSGSVKDAAYLVENMLDD